MRISHKRSPQYDKNFELNVAQVRAIFSIRVINENQLELLMIINKQLLMRMSRQSQANLKSRTQSATIPIFARHSRLYIYKKWKCVEMLTVSRMHVDRFKKICQYGYINQFFATPIVHSSLQSIRGGRKFTLIRIARCNGWAG